MAQRIWLENARMWLTNEVHERRRLDLLIALGMLAVSAASVAFGVWLIGFPFTAGVLMGMGVVYLVYGRFVADRPVISAETSRPRTLGVARNPIFTRNVYEQGHVDISYAIGFLMAPIHLVVEAARSLRQRSRLQSLDVEPVADLLAQLTEQRAAIPADEVVSRLPDGEATLHLLAGLRGVVLLNNPRRISLTDTVADEIRSD
jgi:hypothetical protein